MAVMERLLPRREEPAVADETTTQRTTRAIMEPTAGEVRKRQHDRWGGINWGAVFFGWVVAIGIGSLLTGLVVATGTAVSLTEVPANVADAPGAIGVSGGIVIFVIAMLAYFAGGYVAGRMTRFDGGRQGLGVWSFGLLVAAALAIVGVVAGGEYNVFSGLDLPRVPVDEGTLTSTGAIVLVAVVIGSLATAVTGGTIGQRYHRRVDWTGNEG
jgi:hypothetical protein